MRGGQEVLQLSRRGPLAQGSAGDSTTGHTGWVLLPALEAVAAAMVVELLGHCRAQPMPRC